MDSKTSFISFLQQSSELSELQAGEQAFAREEVLPFLQYTQMLQTIAERNTLLQEIAPYQTQVDGFHASMLALICGILVEQGADVALSIHKTLELMEKQLLLINEYADLDENISLEQAFPQKPDAARAQAGFLFLVQAVMTMLCRDKETRKQWQQREDIISLLDTLYQKDAIPWYLKQVFSLLEDKQLLILDPLNKRGFLTNISGVHDVTYHVYALLQHTILQHTGPGYLDAEPTDPEAVRYAQNYDLTPEDYEKAQNLSDHQRFGFTYPGTLFFPGSAEFGEIPTIDGLPFLFIEKKTITFGWQPSNMYPVLHEALKSQVELVRELTLDEVNAYLQRLA